MHINGTSAVILSDDHSALATRARVQDIRFPIAKFTTEEKYPTDRFVIETQFYGLAGSDEQCDKYFEAFEQAEKKAIPWLLSKRTR